MGVAAERGARRIPQFPLYQTLHRWVPVLRDDPEPREAPGPDERRRPRPGSPAAPARSWTAWRRRRPRRLATAGGLLALVLVATPPWHGIAFARFGDSPVYETLRREATRVLYLPVWPGDSAAPRALSLRDHADAGADGQRLLAPRAAALRPVTSSSRSEPLNVGDLGPVEAAALRRLGVSHVVVDRAVSRPRSRRTRRCSRSSAFAPLPSSPPARGGSPLALPGHRRGRSRRPGTTSPVGVFYEAEWQGQPDGHGRRRAGGLRAAASSAARPGVDRPGFLTLRALPATPGRGVRRALPGARPWSPARRRHRLGPAVLAERDGRPRPGLGRRGPPVRRRARPAARAPRRLGRQAGGARSTGCSSSPQDRPDAEWTYEAEALPHRLGDRSDPDGLGRLGRYADPVESLRGALLGGPARLFPAGRYQLSVRLRADGAGRGPLVRLAVTEPAGTDAGHAARSTPPSCRPAPTERSTLDFDAPAVRPSSSFPSPTWATSASSSTASRSLPGSAIPRAGSAGRRGAPP